MLKDPADLRVAREAPSPTGTYMLMMVRLRNRGQKADGARDWGLFATTISGDTYSAKVVGVIGDLDLPIPQNSGAATVWILSPADNLAFKAIHPIQLGDNVAGYLLF